MYLIKLMENNILKTLEDKLKELKGNKEKLNEKIIDLEKRKRKMNNLF